MTQASLAARLGINRVTLNRQLANNPTIGYLHRLAEAIGCDVIDFFADEAKEEQSTRAVDLNGKSIEIDGVRYKLTRVEEQQ